MRRIKQGARPRPAAPRPTTMPAHVRAHDVDLDDDDREHVRRRVETRLGRLGHMVERVSVRFTDENGPRGGVDVTCRIKVVLRGADTVVVEQQHHDARACFDLALDSVLRAVRSRARQRTLAPRRPSRARPRRARRTTTKRPRPATSD